jgi:hypothetical protein
MGAGTEGGEAGARAVAEGSCIGGDRGGGDGLCEWRSLCRCMSGGGGWAAQRREKRKKSLGMRGVHFAAVFATTAAVAAQNQVAARFGHTAGDGLSVNMYTYIYT